MNVTFHVYEDMKRLVAIPDDSWPLYYSHGLTVGIETRRDGVGTIIAKPHRDEQGRPRYGWVVSENLERYVPDNADGSDGMTIPGVLVVDDLGGA